MKIIGRHKGHGYVITESEDEKLKGETCYRRFTATIRGFRGWRLYEGYMYMHALSDAMRRAAAIRDKIDAGDEDIFEHEYYRKKFKVVKIEESEEEK